MVKWLRPCEVRDSKSATALLFRQFRHVGSILMQSILIFAVSLGCS